MLRNFICKSKSPAIALVEGANRKVLMMATHWRMTSKSFCRPSGYMHRSLFYSDYSIHLCRKIKYDSMQFKFEGYISLSKRDSKGWKRIRSKENRRNQWNPIRNSTGFSCPDSDRLTFHGLRYVFAQQCEKDLKTAKDSNAMKKVSVQLGHYRIAITKIYSDKI